MDVTNKQPTARANKRRQFLDNLPATTFPAAINPHVYDPSLMFKLESCLTCGQPRSHKLHIQPHAFEINLSSKRGSCMCGLTQLNPIHRGLQ